MGWSYGDYDYFCQNIPSLGACNLFVKQFLDDGQPPQVVFGSNLNRQTAGIGIQSTCQILSVHAPNSVGNVANIVLCGLSVAAAGILAYKCGQRAAAVGRGEMRIFMSLYGLTCILQLLDQGAFLNQGSAVLAWLTSLHVGVVVALFWVLLWVASLSLQIVEDGRPSSYAPMLVPAFILFVGSTYISLDTSFSVSGYFRTSLAQVHSAWLFSLTVIWPAVAILIYYVLNIWVSVTVLRETKPVIYFTGTLFVFALSQGARYGISHIVCNGSDRNVDGSFLGTLLETVALVCLYISWTSITEDEWLDHSTTYSNAGMLEQYS